MIKTIFATLFCAAFCLAQSQVEKPLVTVFPFDSRSVVTSVPIGLGLGDHFQFHVTASSKEVTSVKLEVEIQDDGRLIKVSQSKDTDSDGKALFAVFVSSVWRSVIVSKKVFQRVDKSVDVVE